MKQVVLSFIVLALTLVSVSAHAGNYDNCPFHNMTKNSKLLRGDDTNPPRDIAAKKDSSRASVSIGK